MQPNKTSIAIGAILGMIAVVIGALNAHKFKTILTPDQIETIETGVKYQFIHALALVAAGILYAFYPNAWIARATTCFTIGTLCFSFSLYALIALKHAGKEGLGAIGIITPIGGLFLIVGWLFILTGVLSSK